MMRIMACALVGLFAFSISGCGGHQHADDSAHMATCSMCKGSYEWVYSPKGLRLGKKEVSHNCPMCKKGWSAGVDTASTCPECSKSELKCPMCAKAAAK